MAMKLSTGKVAFPIEFDNGDKDCIYFNPNDKDLREGFYNFQSRIEEQTKQIDFEKYKSRYENGFNFDSYFPNFQYKNSPKNEWKI